MVYVAKPNIKSFLKHTIFMKTSRFWLRATIVENASSSKHPSSICNVHDDIKCMISFMFKQRTNSQLLIFHAFVLGRVSQTRI